MGATECFDLVDFVEGGGAGAEEVRVEHFHAAGRIGLSAASDASAGTGHDFDDVEGFFRRSWPYREELWRFGVRWRRRR